MSVDMVKKQTKGPRPKHIPQRTCIACQRTEPKRGLFRIVRDQVGRVAFDATGKQAGRGAYLCHDPACWEQALKRQTLTKSLRMDALHPDDVAALQQRAHQLVADESAETR
jgi:hypothetical protein